MNTYHQTKFGCQRISSSEDIVVRVIIILIWALAVTLTLKTANTFCSAWHSGSFCSITIPSLVTKCFVIHKISSGQIFTDIFNLRCDLDLERSDPIFPQDTLAYNVVLRNLSLVAKGPAVRYSRNSHILIIWALIVILTLTIVNHFFLPDNLPRNNTPPYQVWFNMVERFRRYCPNKIGHTDRMTDRQTEWF